MTDKDRTGIAFLDDRRLITYEVLPPTAESSFRQSADVSGPFRLHASVIDADSGKSLITREWGTSFRNSRILVTSGGVVVRTGETLRFLSKDFVELQWLRFVHRDRDEEWELRVSASQQTVLLNYSKQHWKQHQNASRFVVLDGNSFEVKQTWNLSPALHSKLYSVSDHAIAVDSHLKPPEHIFMSEFGEDRWTPIWQKARPCNTWAVLALIRDNSFVYGCKEFYFVAAGRITMKEEFGRSEEPVSGKISVTPDGRLVAISLRQLKGGFFDTERYTKALHVVVYDLFLKKRVLTMVIAPLPKNDYDFALSPDGSKLAILNDRNVSVCSVPAPGNSTK